MPLGNPLPLRRQLRNEFLIAGMADLAGWDNAVDQSRLSLLVREARQAIPAMSDYLQIEPWNGLRPATPTNLPILGPTPLCNLLLNVGQGALGFTLAMGSAQIIADLAAGRPAASRPPLLRRASHRLDEAKHRTSGARFAYWSNPIGRRQAQLHAEIGE